MPTCSVPGCTEPRWAGPNGTNRKLTMCEKHQRDEWRDYKAKHPRPSTGRGRGRPAKQPTDTVKALVIDYASGKVYRGVMKITTEKQLCEVRQLKSLIGFYQRTGHVIVERNK